MALGSSTQKMSPLRPGLQRLGLAFPSRFSKAEPYLLFRCSGMGSPHSELDQGLPITFLWECSQTFFRRSQDGTMTPHSDP